jgi:hypothetical protein
MRRRFFFALLVVVGLLWAAYVDRLLLGLLAGLAVVAGLVLLLRRGLQYRERRRMLGLPGLADAEPAASKAALTWAFTKWQPRFSAATVEVVDRTAYVRHLVPASPPPHAGAEPTAAERSRGWRKAAEAHRDLLASQARALVDLTLTVVPGLERVAIALFQPMVHPTLGHPYHGCVLAVLVERALWSSIVHQNVTAENALRNFPLRFRFDRHLQPREVAPFEPPGPAGPAESAPPLDQLDPLEFEAAVRDLLAAMGYEARLTQASHDGGVDIEAFNPQPIVGGRVVVQCKRTSGTIGAAVVRELYGVVTAANATKGVLITTSDFSTDARQFAENKPLDLINGRQLEQLIQRYR